MLIPNSVFAKYESIVNSFVEELGVDCTLVYAAKVVETTDYVSPFKNQNTLLDPMGLNGFNLGDQSYKIEETTETIKLRVYLTEKDWKKISSVQLPQGSVMAIGYLSDLNKIQRADHIIIHDTKYYKAAEPTVHGLTNKHLMSFWKLNG